MDGVAGYFHHVFHVPVPRIDRCLVNAMRGAGKSMVPMVTAQFGAFPGFRSPISWL